MTTTPLRAPVAHHLFAPGDAAALEVGCLPTGVEDIVLTIRLLACPVIPGRRSCD
jgi:hypothetical protein